MPIDPAAHARANILLAQLPEADRRRLLERAEPVACIRGSVMIDPDGVPDSVLFPVSAVISIEEPLATRAGIGVAVVGREGFAGWPALLGADRWSQRAMAQCADGVAWRVGLATLIEECRDCPPLNRVLLRYVHVVMAQIGHTCASQIEHGVDRRIAAWILMRHDRIDGDELPVRHDEIADAINSRRASVTDALHRLEGDQLIRCRRERLAVRDRAGLQAFAGEAYGTSEALYRRLIAPFGKGEAAVPVIATAHPAAIVPVAAP